MKVYSGTRDEQGRPKVYVRDIGIELWEPRATELKHRYRYSDDGFEWGYGGSGPADLARSILWDHLDHEPATGLYMMFKWGVVASLARQWTLTSDDIDQWLCEVQGVKVKP